MNKLTCPPFGAKKDLMSLIPVQVDSKYRRVENCVELGSELGFHFLELSQ